MTTGARRSVRGDGERVEALAQDNESWTWTVIFTTAMLCWLSLAVLCSVSIG